jgi:hypothetical protein
LQTIQQLVMQQRETHCHGKHLAKERQISAVKRHTQLQMTLKNGQFALKLQRRGAAKQHRHINMAEH